MEQTSFDNRDPSKWYSNLRTEDLKENHKRYEIEFAEQKIIAKHEPGEELYATELLAEAKDGDKKYYCSVVGNNGYFKRYREAEHSIRRFLSVHERLNTLKPHCPYLFTVRHISMTRSATVRDWDKRTLNYDTYYLIHDEPLTQTYENALTNRTFSSIKEFEDFAFHMATALAHLHSLNIKHGEITPDTIYYEESAKHYKLVLPINRPEDPMRGWERNGDYDYPRYLVTDKYKHYLLSPEFKGYNFSKPQDVFALGGIYDVLVHSDFEDGLDGDYYRFGDAKPQKEKKIGALAKLVHDTCSPGWYMFKLIEAMREVDPEKRITAAQVARTIQDQQSKNALGTKLATVLAFYDVDIE